MLREFIQLILNHRHNQAQIFPNPETVDPKRPQEAYLTGDGISR